MKKEETTIDKLKQKVKDIKEGAKEKDEKIAECKKDAKQADDKDKKIEELTDHLQRMQAEFENYKKYVERRNSDFVKYAKADIIEKLLPLLDSFELALKHTEKKDEFIKGMELVFSQLYGLLEKEGLKKIKCEGKLDTNYHEVLLKQESDKEDDTIIEELQKGYMLGDKVIRYSKVKVSKKKC